MTPYHLAARGDHAGLWDWNLATNRVHFSPRWIAMVGGDEHAVGTSPESWLTRVHPDDAGEVRRALDEHLAGATSELDLAHRLLHADGTYRWMACHAVIVRDEHGKPLRVMGCHSDVTAEKVSDALTGLPNRALFMDHLARALNRAQRNPAHHFAVLLVDLGRSTPHDDEHVATSPDLLLTAAARRLETCLRAGVDGARPCRDHLVARLRGDEFGVLLDGLADVGDARVVAEQLLADLLSPFTVGGSEVFLSASAGIAVSATGYSQPQAVLRDADTARHRAAMLGGARCEMFDTAILQSAQNASRLDMDLVAALSRGEFSLVYQPVVALKTRRVAGFEALLRWQHPERGPVSPADFIPIAEKTGFIVELGRWSLREACRQLAAWRASQPAATDIWVSVNLSSRQFSHSALADEVAQVLTATGLPARALVVELTESVAMANPPAVKSVLMQLRALGVRVALDDFGTGQSSLAYLHQFPADKLKLDRSFVCHLESRADMRDIVRAVTGLAHQLGLEVIVEGVETEGQLAHVQSLGCEFVQGFVFSKAVPSPRAVEWLEVGFPSRSDPASADEPHEGARPDDEPALAIASGRKRARKALYAAAAAATILALAGLLAGHLRGPLPAVLAPAVRIASPAQPVAPPARDTATPGPATLQQTRPKPRAATPAAPPARAAARIAVHDLRVMHKHAVTSCSGQLSITPSGLVYRPDKEQDRAKDGFSLPFAAVTPSVSGAELTIKSDSRTYRFKAANAAGDAEARARVGDFGKRLASARSAK